MLESSGLSGQVVDVEPRRIELDATRIVNICPIHSSGMASDVHNVWQGNQGDAKPIHAKGATDRVAGLRNRPHAIATTGMTKIPKNCVSVAMAALALPLFHHSSGIVSVFGAGVAQARLP
jgi:hypothetical protein